MPIPREVMEAINGIGLVGVPQDIGPGESLSVGLSPSPRSLEAFTVGQRIQEVDASVTLAPFGIGIASGEHAVHTESDSDQLLASLTSNVRTSPPLRTLQWDISWFVLDADHNNLAGIAYVVNADTDGNDRAAIRIFPQIEEFSGDASGFDVRFIGAKLTVATDLGTVTRLIGPIAVNVTKLPVPTLVVLSQHANFSGLGLVGIPTTSPFTTVAGIAETLKTLREDLERIRGTAASENFFHYATLARGVAFVIAAMSQPLVLMRRGDVAKLSDVCYETWSIGPIGPFCRLSAAGQVSAMALIGQNGLIHLFNLPKWSAAKGALSVRTGDANCAFMSDFASLTSPGSAGRPLDEWTAGEGSANVVTASAQEPPWNDQVASFRWVTQEC